MTLTEFLLARIAEDEAVARAAATAPRPRGGWGGDGEPAGERWQTREERHGGRRTDSGMLYVPTIENDADAALWDDEGGCDYMAPAPEVGAHIARHDPARVLAECEAKRRIVERSTWVADRKRVPTDRPGVYDMVDVVVVNEDAEDTLRILASVYADHADYREEWRP